MRRLLCLFLGHRPWRPTEEFTYTPFAVQEAGEWCSFLPCTRCRAVYAEFNMNPPDARPLISGNTITSAVTTGDGVAGGIAE